jgi:hypothetical protein
LGRGRSARKPPLLEEQDQKDDDQDESENATTDVHALPPFFSGKTDEEPVRLRVPEAYFAPMRAIDCWCGRLVDAPDDEGLYEALRAHDAAEHGGEHTEAEIRERIGASAYDPPTGEPPWAY